MKYILTYGIACVEEVDGKKELIAEISDVTTDRDEAEHLVELLNDHQLPPEHLSNIVDDMLAKV